MFLLQNLCKGGFTAKKTNCVDYVKEGQKLLQAADYKPIMRYSPVDELWRHPKTGATLYVGNAAFASTRGSLKEYGVTRIVNCQDKDRRNYFEGDPEIEYLHFTIGCWQGVAGVHDGDYGTWQYWEPYFKFITESLRDGHNVLVHCLAGAHRAGTAGIAALMLLANLDFDQATTAAKDLRPVIDPIGAFPELLQLLERAMVGRDQSYQHLLGLEVDSEDASTCAGSIGVSTSTAHWRSELSSTHSERSFGRTRSDRSERSFGRIAEDIEDPDVYEVSI